MLNSTELTTGCLMGIYGGLVWMSKQQESDCTEYNEKLDDECIAYFSPIFIWFLGGFPNPHCNSFHSLLLPDLLGWAEFAITSTKVLFTFVVVCLVFLL